MLLWLIFTLTMRSEITLSYVVSPYHISTIGYICFICMVPYITILPTLQISSAHFSRQLLTEVAMCFGNKSLTDRDFIEAGSSRTPSMFIIRSFSGRIINWLNSLSLGNVVVILNAYFKTNLRDLFIVRFYGEKGSQRISQDPLKIYENWSKQWLKAITRLSIT